jgi:transposase
MTFNERAATMSRDEVAELLASHDQLLQQIAWFKRQLFGAKSERRMLDADGRQLALGEWGRQDAATTSVTVGKHLRRTRTNPPEESDDTLRFDDSVPVEEVLLPAPDVDEDDEIVGQKVTLRLAQKPSSFVVLKFIRPVVKRKDGSLACAPAPAGVLGKSIADVSLLAGMAIDKFAYHLPLYRQHQRMQAAGIHLARSTLTHLVHRTADLLRPIYEAQLYSVVSGKVVAMDETPIRAGRKRKGKMNTGYFWPIYGDRGEVVFPFSDSRSGAFIKKSLRDFCGVLLSDGYKAYEKYASQINDVVHAQCWSHTRRQFLKAETIEPELTEKALESIRGLYEAESRLDARHLDGGKRLELRAKSCKPIVDEFFEWLKTALEQHALLPSNPFTAAADYTLAREDALRVFLQYPDVPIDTNHLEREIRPIAVGRKNWLFCWTEVGAEYAGIVQSLISTCRLQEIDPYTYLVDVLQRVDDHPAADVDALTPRLWKERFADQPRRSIIDGKVNDAGS